MDKSGAIELPILKIHNKKTFGKLPKGRIISKMQFIPYCYVS